MKRRFSVKSFNNEKIKVGVVMKTLWKTACSGERLEGNFIECIVLDMEKTKKNWKWATKPNEFIYGKDEVHYIMQLLKQMIRYVLVSD